MVPECVALNSRRDRLDDLNAVRRHTWNPIFASASIDERPTVVDDRSRVGDWEGDTVIGKNHKGALVTLVERKSLYAIIEAVERRTAAAVHGAIVANLTAHI